MTRCVTGKRGVGKALACGWMRECALAEGRAGDERRARRARGRRASGDGEGAVLARVRVRVEEGRGSGGSSPVNLRAHAMLPLSVKIPMLTAQRPQHAGTSRIKMRVGGSHLFSRRPRRNRKPRTTQRAPVGGVKPLAPNKSQSQTLTTMLRGMYLRVCSQMPK